MSDKKKMSDVIKADSFVKTSLDSCMTRHHEYMKLYMSDRLGVNFDDLSDEERVRLTLELIHAIDDELSEIRNWLPWKHWKRYDNFKIDRSEILFEIIDIQHFIFGLLLIWNVTDPLDAGKLFMAKLSENIRRQERGY